MRRVLLGCIALCFVTTQATAFVQESTKVIQRPNDLARWAALAFALTKLVGTACQNQWLDVPACARTVHARLSSALRPEQWTALRAAAYRFCRASVFGWDVKNTVCPLLLPAQQHDSLFHKIFRLHSCVSSECKKEKDALLQELRTQYVKNPIIFWEQCQNVATQFFTKPNDTCTHSGWLAKRIAQPSVKTPPPPQRPRSEQVFKRSPPPSKSETRARTRARATQQREECEKHLASSLPKEERIGDSMYTKITSAVEAYERIQKANEYKLQCRNRGLIGYDEENKRTIKDIVTQVAHLPPLQCTKATTPIPNILPAYERKIGAEKRFLPGEARALELYKKIWNKCPNPEYVRESVLRLVIIGKYGDKQHTDKFIADNLIKLDRKYNPLYTQEAEKSKLLTLEEAKAEVARMHQEISDQIHRATQVRVAATGRKTTPPQSMYDRTKRAFLKKYGRARHVQYLFEQSYRALFPGQTKPLPIDTDQ
ncbi:MAG: hypothetical protein KGO83_07005 [Paenibacillaceae bacterium]|nr:hypothetical protein [Paenibacillaceae bacterium]